MLRTSEHLLRPGKLKICDNQGEKEVGPLFNNFGGNYQQNPMYGGFQQPQQMFQQQRMDFLQSMQPQQQSGIQARPVTGREEAVAATVFPGTPMLFLDRANGAVYYKAIDPNTGAGEFVDFAIVRPEQHAAPQYVTVDMFEQWRAEIEQRFQQTNPVRRQQKGADTE